MGLTGPGHQVGDYVEVARDVYYLVGELGHVRQLPLLAGSPGVRYPQQGEGQRFVVGPHGEVAALQMVPEVAKTDEYAKKFPVKSTVG